jgi:hypothetical protein
MKIIQPEYNNDIYDQDAYSYNHYQEIELILRQSQSHTYDIFRLYIFEDLDYNKIDEKIPSLLCTRALER